MQNEGKIMQKSRLETFMEESAKKFPSAAPASPLTDESTTLVSSTAVSSLLAVDSQTS